METANMVNQQTQGKKISTLKDYQILKELGRGSYGKVFLAQKIGEDKQVALKILDKHFLVRVINSQYNLAL